MAGIGQNGIVSEAPKELVKLSQAAAPALGDR